MLGFFYPLSRPRFLLLALLGVLGYVAGTPAAQAQGRYMTRAGHISFFSVSIMEDIEAHNEKVAAVVDLTSGQMAFSVPIREFSFHRTLMQEHFNENYMESDKYPRATFTGQLLNLPLIVKQLAGGLQKVDAEGNLTLHGVTHKVQLSGTIQQRDGALVVFAYFNVAPADYAIDIPMLVREHIAKSVGIRVNITCPAVTTEMVSQP